MSELPEHVARNRAYWDDFARQCVEAGERAWAREEPASGGSTTPKLNFAPHAGYSSNTGSIFRSSIATLKRPLTRMRALTSLSLNMAPAYGQIHSAGFPRRRACCDQGVN